MHPPARVTSIDALRDFRAALATFRFEAIDALAANDLDIRRATGAADFLWGTLVMPRGVWRQQEAPSCPDLFRASTSFFASLPDALQHCA